MPDYENEDFEADNDEECAVGEQEPEIDYQVLEMYKHLQVKKKKEQYDIYDLHLLQMFRKEEDLTMKDHGITCDFSASQYLKEKLRCQDPRVGKYNVLRFSNPDLDFERIFVFFDTSKNKFKIDSFRSGESKISGSSVQQLLLTRGIESGVKQLKELLKCFNLVFAKIYQKADDLKGIVAEVSQPLHNEYDNDSIHSDDSRYDKSKYTIDISDMTIIEFQDI